jgi:hypothetical protein
MDISTMLIIAGTASLVLAKLGVMAFCVYKIAESFQPPFYKNTMLINH